MGIAALVTVLVLHVHAVQARQQLLAHPVMPAQGTITSPYGHDGARWHPGIDIGILRSLDVQAAVPGRVVLVGTARGYEGYGNVVVVRWHGYEEVYGHLATWRVRVGQFLVPGQHIATAGCTGWCTGTHLHFEVRRHGKTVSPFATVLRPLRMPPVVQQPRLLVTAPFAPRSPRMLASAAGKPLR